jgi:hypothetical protein
MMVDGKSRIGVRLKKRENRILSISGQICQERNVHRSEIADIQRILGTHRHILQALSSKEAK